MEISHFGASIPQRSWHTSTWDAWYNWIFGKRVLSGTVEDNVLETTEGLRTKKAQDRKVTTKYYTIQTPPYCKELLRTKYYAVPRSIYYYTLESTTQYSQVFLHTTKYYSVLQSTTNASCLEKIQHFALRRTPRNLTKMLRLPRKVRLQNHQILRLSRKVTLQNQQMARVPSKVTLQHHQMLRLPQKMSSFPFLTVTLLLLSWLACSISQL